MPRTINPGHGVEIVSTKHHRVSKPSRPIHPESMLRCSTTTLPAVLLFVRRDLSFSEIVSTLSEAAFIYAGRVYKK